MNEPSSDSCAVVPGRDAGRARDGMTAAIVHVDAAAGDQPRERRTQRAASREAALAGVAIGYPEELPVSQRRDDIAAAIRDHQVVIVAGETGSGKTTQLPKICLELGRGVAGQIGHTQPRRIAARTVAERIAEELGTQLGEVVGYKVRFTDKSGDATAVKLMTDGILLAEIGTDRNLHRYDTLIIDEAHERSLNIDFILGYLRQLLPRRPDLKVIITSATIDPERFAEHFKDPRTGEPAPIVEVSGRTYPVEVRYRPDQRPRAREDRRGPRPGHRHHRRDRRAGARGTGRHPRLPLRRAGDPRHRRRAQGHARTPTSCRCTPGCRPPSSTGSSRSREPHHGQPPRRARHQRRRDLAHRALASAT